MPIQTAGTEAEQSGVGRLVWALMFVGGIAIPCWESWEGRRGQGKTGVALQRGGHLSRVRKAGWDKGLQAGTLARAGPEQGEPGAARGGAQGLVGAGRKLRGREVDTKVVRSGGFSEEGGVWPRSQARRPGATPQPPRGSC